MTNLKHTKRALFSSVVALLVCFTMLLGTTFAWFTDSATSSGNVIKTGTLKVSLEHADTILGVDEDGWKDASSDVIFNYDKWEPGYTAVKYVKIENEGTLDLKFILNIIPNEAAEEVNLADVIEVYMVSGATTVDRDALTTDSAAYVGTLASLMNENDGAAHGVLYADDADKAGNVYEIYTIALKMSTSAGNEYQNRTVGGGFAVQLLATQLSSESDSFDNQYDAEAAWDGTIPTEKPETLVVDTVNKVISINDTAAFAYLNTLVNDANFYANYGSTWYYTIELNTDVNLFNQPWTPINLSNFVAFDGNDHTISNLYVSTTGDKAGLFADIKCNDIGVTYVRNLTIDGAYVKGNNSVGVLAGASTQGAIENVTINNATVIGNKYVGGVFGWGNGSVNDSTVKNSTVTISEGGEKEAGGLIGYVSNDGNATDENKVIAGNTVENVTVTAPTIASGLVAQPNSSNKGGAVIEIKNNTMKNVTVITEDLTGALWVSNNVNGTTVVGENTADENSKVCYQVPGTTIVTDKTTQTVTINSAKDLAYLSVLANGKWAELYSDGNGTTFTNYNKGAGKEYYYRDSWKVVLNADIDLQNKAWTPVDITFFGTFDGQNHVISNLNVNSSDKFAGLFSSANGVENLKIENAVVKAGENAGAVAGYIVGDVKNVNVINANITGPKYAGGIAGSAYGSFTDCSITDSTVTGNRKDAGGIVGFLNETRTLTGNKVNNTTVQIKDSAETDRNIGAIVGRWNYPQKTGESTLSGNTTDTTYALVGAVANGTMPEQAD